MALKLNNLHQPWNDPRSGATPAPAWSRSASVVRATWRMRVRPTSGIPGIHVHVFKQQTCVRGSPVPRNHRLRMMHRDGMKYSDTRERPPVVAVRSKLRAARRGQKGSVHRPGRGRPGRTFLGQQEPQHMRPCEKSRGTVTCDGSMAGHQGSSANGNLKSAPERSGGSCAHAGRQRQHDQLSAEAASGYTGLTRVNH